MDLTYLAGAMFQALLVLFQLSEYGGDHHLVRLPAAGVSVVFGIGLVHQGRRRSIRAREMMTPKRD